MDTLYQPTTKVDDVVKQIADVAGVKEDSEKRDKIKRNLFKSKRELIEEYFLRKVSMSFVWLLGIASLTMLLYSSRYLDGTWTLAYSIAHCLLIAASFLFGARLINFILYLVSDSFYTELIAKKSKNSTSLNNIPIGLDCLTLSYVNEAGYRLPIIYGLDEKETTSDELAFDENIEIDDIHLSREEAKQLTEAQGKSVYRQALLILNKTLRQAKINETKAKYGKHCI